MQTEMQIREFKNLEQILDWAKIDPNRLHSLDLIQQDEYSYDLILVIGPTKWISFSVS